MQQPSLCHPVAAGVSCSKLSGSKRKKKEGRNRLCKICQISMQTHTHKHLAFFFVFFLGRKAALGSFFFSQVSCQGFQPSKYEQGKDCACAYKDSRSARRQISGCRICIKGGSEDKLSSENYIRLLCHVIKDTWQ